MWAQRDEQEVDEMQLADVPHAADCKGADWHYAPQMGIFAARYVCRGCATMVKAEHITAS